MLQDTNCILYATASLRVDGIDLRHKLPLLVFCSNRPIFLPWSVEQANFFRKLNAQPKPFVWRRVADAIMLREPLKSVTQDSYALVRWAPSAVSDGFLLSGPKWGGGKGPLR